LLLSLLSAQLFPFQSLFAMVVVRMSSRRLCILYSYLLLSSSDDGLIRCYFSPPAGADNEDAESDSDRESGSVSLSSEH
jgi:hypothetical protein